MHSLGSREKQALLQVARRALTLAVEGGETHEDLSADATLTWPGAAFVTLHAGKRLRGCIGQLDWDEPLAQVVGYCAKAAGLEDPRFEPVRPDELPGIEIEISVLSPLEEIAPDSIRVGEHGLVVSRGWQRGVLLPQVATQYRWDARRFLEETCVKAGLERDAWKDPATRINGFSAEVFSEADFRSRLKA
jgi:AmmeMemoRadiSam system protein A